jgi:TRAP-type C4-dicarboxylate transport system permease small subunit
VGVFHAIVDVILFLAAVLSLVAFALLAYAGWTIYKLAMQTKREVESLTQTGKDALTEVRGTTKLMSESVVKPTAMALGFATSIAATIRALAEDVDKKRRQRRAD